MFIYHDILIYCYYIDMFIYRQHHISTASAYLSSITLVFCFWKKKSAPLPKIHRSLTFQGWLNSTELNLETKCSMFQENVKFPLHRVTYEHKIVTFSHQYVAFKLIMQKKYSFKRKHFSVRRNCDIFTQICFQDKLLKSIFELSDVVWVDIELVSRQLVSYLDLCLKKACSLLATPFMQRRTHVYTSFYLLGAKNLISWAPVFDLGKSFITV